LGNEFHKFHKFKDNISMSDKNLIDVYLEVGKKKCIAGAIEWPGWCRIGRSEDEALAAMVDYGARFGKVLADSGIDFNPPADVSHLVVVERLEGNATTDFGAPDMAPEADERPFDKADQQRSEVLLTACWRAFDKAAAAAVGKTLQKGPRGGGRELDGIKEHVLEADRGYLSKLGWKFKRDKSTSLETSIEACRAAILEGLGAAVRGEIAPKGPRGGVRWNTRYYVRRTAWHTLDHVWEIENRIQ
jgi:hypothetical protein